MVGVGAGTRTCVRLSVETGELSVDLGLRLSFAIKLRAVQYFAVITGRLARRCPKRHDALQ